MRMDEGQGDSLPSLLVEVRVRKSLYAQGPSERFSRVPGGPCLNLVRGAPMRMVDADCSRVEAALQAGELACPVCFQPLSPWGWGRSDTCVPTRASCPRSPGAASATPA